MPISLKNNLHLPSWLENLRTTSQRINQQPQARRAKVVLLPLKKQELVSLLNKRKERV